MSSNPYYEEDAKADTGYGGKGAKTQYASYRPQAPPKQAPTSPPQNARPRAQTQDQGHPQGSHVQPQAYSPHGGPQASNHQFDNYNNLQGGPKGGPQGGGMAAGSSKTCKAPNMKNSKLLRILRREPTYMLTCQLYLYCST